MDKIYVVYWSQSGNTQAMAEAIGKGIEKGLIEFCAPTLAGIKCASLFNYFHEGEQIARRELDEINKLLNKKGVNAEILVWKEKSALLYVYRWAMLESELKQPGVFELLESYGYESRDIDICLKHLRCRFSEDSCFPHEIGVFLGYPLEDVKGFIANKGKNCESCEVSFYILLLIKYINKDFW